MLIVCLGWASCGIHAHDITHVQTALETEGRHHLELEVASTDQRTTIPLTILTGPKQGPTLLVLSGIHGSEYAPIVASQRLAQTVSPADLSGSVILVHIANMPAYLGRSIYISPSDQKNLNRIFPGRANGTLSDRIAFMLSDKIYPLADAVLDMHSGDGNEDLRPMWVGYYAKAGNPDVIAASKAMAHAFGFAHIVEFQWELTDPALAIWAGSAAVARGIPSIDVEAGGMNVINKDAVVAIQNGVLRIMAHMGIKSTEFPPTGQQHLIRERSWISAPQDGSWVPLVDAGQTVKQNDLIGYLTDWHGRKVFEARAPHSGLLLLTLTAPPTKEGETVAIIAKLASD